MEPLVITAALQPTIEMAAKILSRRDKKAIAEEAISISKKEPESQSQVRLLFTDTKKRLASTWKIGIGMTITLFFLFVGMAITAVFTGIMFEKPMWSIVFGGISVSSLITVILWKPFDKTFQATD